MTDHIGERIHRLLQEISHASQLRLSATSRIVKARLPVLHSTNPPPLHMFALNVPSKPRTSCPLQHKMYHRQLIRQRPLCNVSANSSASEAMEHVPVVRILNQEIDGEGKTPSYFRMLVDEKHIKYIIIDHEIYETEDLCFPLILLKKPPTFPGGSWNSGNILKMSKDIIFNTWQEALPCIKPLLHPECYEYISLAIKNSLKSHVYEVTSSSFQDVIIAKHARCRWDVIYYSRESLVYSWIQGHGIGPNFLGYVAEEGRVTGFLMEFVAGRHACASDLAACKTVVQKLHSLGILHGDRSRHNFLITEDRAVLLDFETARRTDDLEEMQKELEGLDRQLIDESGDRGNLYRRRIKKVVQLIRCCSHGCRALIKVSEKALKEWHMATIDVGCNVEFVNNNNRINVW